uniref:Uncharacterized protein n=1 Tax=Oryza glumipatula TaxID=40148 RepID=A0A0E0AV91_9ORYZ
MGRIGIEKMSKGGCGVRVIVLGDGIIQVVVVPGGGGVQVVVVPNSGAEQQGNAGGAEEDKVRWRRERKKRTAVARERNKGRMTAWERNKFSGGAMEDGGAAGQD